MARRARLASRDPGLVLADGRAETADPRRRGWYCTWHKSDGAEQSSGCVAGAPLRSPPRLREDATGPQHAGLGSPLRVTGAAHQRLQAWATALTPMDPETGRSWYV
jgi:hypothetical protein